MIYNSVTNKKNHGVLLNLVVEPNPILHIPSDIVPIIDDNIRELMDNMLATMYYNDGIGLAAVQVGILKRVIVIDLDGPDNNRAKSDICVKQPLFMVNPEIEYLSQDKSSYNEGCLSFPDIHIQIERNSDIKVRYLDYYGKNQILEVKSGLLSTCIQHEVDHTNGIVITDHISKLKRQLINKKLLKNEKNKS